MKERADARIALDSYIHSMRSAIEDSNFLMPSRALGMGSRGYSKEKSEP